MEKEGNREWIPRQHHDSIRTKGMHDCWCVFVVVFVVCAFCFALSGGLVTDEQHDRIVHDDAGWSLSCLEGSWP